MSRLVGLYGGSFDPVHLGHVVPVEAARQNLGLDEVVYVPAAVPPHNPGGPRATSWDRVAMLALALDGHPALSLSFDELSRTGTSYTIDTLRRFRAERTGDEILLVLDTDSWLTLHTWRSTAAILEEFRVVLVARGTDTYAVCRDGVSEAFRARLAPEGATPRNEAPGGSVFWGGNEPVTISSTWIRNALRSPSPSPLQGSLPPAVERYLRKRNLYRS